MAPLLAAQQAGESVPAQSRESCTATAPAKPALVFIPKGTQINLVLLETVSSKTAKKGQSVGLAVAQDFVVNGIVVIAAGTPALSVITNQRKPIPGKRNGSVWFKPASLMLENGLRLKLLENPPGWNPCGGMGTWCIGYVAMAPYTIVGLVSLLFETHHHPDQPGEDKSLKACWPLPAYTASSYKFSTAVLNGAETAPSVSSTRVLVDACHPEFPPLPYNFGSVKPPTAKIE
jgi:hypothetical protein